MALTPFSGSLPAWAARPWTTISNSPSPLRWVLAVDDDLEIAQALALCLQCPLRPGPRLQHQRPRRLPGQFLDDRPRLDAADLLVGIDQEDRGQRGF